MGNASAIAAVVAIAVAASGCGKADDSGQVSTSNARVKTLSAAAAKTQQVDTATFTFTATDTSSDANDEVLTGSVDRTRDLAETLAKVTAHGTAGDGSGSVTIGHGESEIIIDGDVVFLRTGELGQLFHV